MQLEALKIKYYNIMTRIKLCIPCILDNRLIGKEIFKWKKNCYFEDIFKKYFCNIFFSP